MIPRYNTLVIRTQYKGLSIYGKTAESGIMTFRGTIYADGFGVFIVKQNFKPGLSGRRRRFKIDDVDVPYIHQVGSKFSSRGALIFEL
ncbi:hypothetical protein VTP01DRAFT_9300 [Rhizomucor pusillus]|uniref:uncharacterized protein n=1 Tax=Rhizomucor pusillus TaxID=4840 RepID=UPI0037437EE5